MKFRTMVHNAEEILESHPVLFEMHRANNYKLPIEHDPRVTKVGAFLRGTSLDEIPQLWNVLRGEMSLVGPRPVEPAQVRDLYGAVFRKYYAMRPGLTGVWQVSGRSHVGDKDRAALDLQYVGDWSLWLDLKVLLKTPVAVLRRHGAH